MQKVRGAEIGLVFQEPMTALNPVFTIGNQIEETLHGPRRRARPRGQATRGGAPRRRQHSRAATARARLPAPAVGRPAAARADRAGARLQARRSLIADEPTTALDVTIQAQILDLLRDLQQRSGSALLLITHDLGVVAEMADRVAVMYAGRIVEEAPVRELFRDPRHPYTRGLLASIPGGARGSRLQAIQGTVPPLGQLPPGCAFAPRCPSRFEPCDAAPPGVTIIEARGDDSRGPSRRLLLPILSAPSIRRCCPRRRADAAARRAPPLEGVLAQAGALRASDRRPGCGRRQLLDREGRDVRPGRRIGQRQDHDGTLHPAADRADRRRGAVRRPRRAGAVTRRPAPRAPRHADRLPGSVLVAESAHARGGHRRRAADHPQAGIEGGAAGARQGAVRARRA